MIDIETQRPLTNEEISQLIMNGCQSKDWSRIKVHPDFLPNYIENTSFSGDITLGRFEKKIKLFGGIEFNTGIYNATLHNCIIGDNVFIHNVKSYIANYEIDSEVKIQNVKLLAVDGESTFGNGTKVNVINEGGGRSIPIFDFLSAHVAYILALYRHQPEVIRNLEKLIENYCQSITSSMGRIGKDASIINCDSIKNVNIGPSSILEGVTKLINGSINSNDEAPVSIGEGVIMENFILCSGSRVSDATLVSNCFVGQGCHLDKHYSAVDSVFFANCQGYHGEATSIFAGPYTVTHHKSTLLIAGLFSFLNAGSGSNQSNHLYKLGPIHQGIVERGTKTTSDSYVLWPSKIGAFTLIMGRHYKHSDTTDFPFSYIIEHKDESVLVPGINLSSIGTVRDSQKWPRRDKRTDSNKLDYINFNLLSPYTVQRMIRGRKFLQRLLNEKPQQEKFQIDGMVTNKRSLERGIKLYTMAINKFMGNSLISRIQNKGVDSIASLSRALKPDTETGKGLWVDLAGLFAPQAAIEQWLTQIKHNALNSMEEVDEFLKMIHTNYYNYEWTWVYHTMKEELGIKPETQSTSQLIELIEKWKQAVLGIDESLLADSSKEFSLQKQIGFGIDGGEKVKIEDFNEVRNRQKEASTTISAIKDHMKVKSKLGDKIINLLKSLN